MTCGTRFRTPEIEIRSFQVTLLTLSTSGRNRAEFQLTTGICPLGIERDPELAVLLPPPESLIWRKPKLKTKSTKGRDTKSEFIDFQGVVPRLRQYFEAGINFCLVGPPGIGKTKLIHELAGSVDNGRT